ncbi:Gustatory receptor 155 [Hyalella azteca]|uniref:Gustatory receptor 155 n=2 Tax=Hyalella azteca TaxID=294128 RepID=A0A6A0H0P3_HYAAZ|nr:Gustatory receptor 155 [Hyalella azteca]
MASRGNLFRIKKNRNGLRCLNFISAYTIGLIVFMAVYGISRLRNTLNIGHGRYSKVNTNDILCQLVRADAIVRLYGRISRLYRRQQHPERAAPAKALLILGGVMIFYLDVLFWLITAPGITAPAFFYAFILTVLASLFQTVAQQTDRLLEKFSAREVANMNREISKHSSKIRNLVLWRKETFALEEEIAEETLACHRMYESLVKLTDSANSVFSPMIFFTFIYYGMELCLVLYDLVLTILYRDLGTGYRGLAMQLIYCFVFAGILSMLNEAGQDLQNQGEKFPESMHNVTLKLSSNNRKIFSSPYRQIHQPRGHASHFFSFNRQCTSAVSSGIFTYIIILVQFKNSEVPKE